MMSDLHRAAPAARIGRPLSARHQPFLATGAILLAWQAAHEPFAPAIANVASLPVEEAPHA